MMHVIQTQWTVFTGAPNSGKTSVLQNLGERGFQTRPEFARAYFHAELAKGRTLKDICADQYALQELFLLQGLEQDKALNPQTPYVLDRCPIDAVAHYMLYGFDHAEALEKAGMYRYKKIFFFEALTFIKDEVRIEDEEAAKRLSVCFRKAYDDLGYEIIDVPLMSVEERTEFVLEHI